MVSICRKSAIGCGAPLLTLLVLNAGSSSLKYGVFDAAAERELVSGTIELKDAGDYGAAVRHVSKKMSTPISAVGHRVVHGGEKFRTPVRITAAVKSALRQLEDLAPLHNPPALATLLAAEKAFPKIPQVAVFDTAYYAALPEERIVYPLPYPWYQSWRIRRYGFHGISHAFVAERVASLMKRPLRSLNLISCHLGNGCSATAIRNGKAVATTMGFTPLEGLMMGTRSGSVDPGLLFFLERKHRVSPATLETQLNHASGLLGVSGISGDFRKVERAAKRGHRRARLALTMYADRVREAIGSLAVTLGRVDALAFTAGVGEHSAALRRDVCRGLDVLGIQIDAARNHANQPDSAIADRRSKSQVWIIHTREELRIAQDVNSVLST